jgi:hypothetical protein
MQLAVALQLWRKTTVPTIPMMPAVINTEETDDGRGRSRQTSQMVQVTFARAHFSGRPTKLAINFASSLTSTGFGTNI